MGQVYDAVKSAIQAADKAKKLKDAVLDAYDEAVLDLAQSAAFAAQHDAPQDPPPPSHDPSDVGCPDNADLIPWVFKAVEGAGRPEGVGDGVSAPAEWFEWSAAEKGDSTDRGLLSGLPDVSVVVFRNGIVRWARWWGANGHLAGATFENLDFLETQGEHDVYLKYIGGGPGYTCRNLYSVGTGSQVFQGARRQWEMTPEQWAAKPGPIVLDGWLAVDHARHPSEGGTGTRRSQAFKFFSQQAGTKDAQALEQVPTTVLVRGVTLDDTMQVLSHGPFRIEDYEDAVVEGSVFAGGKLESSATIAEGTGPVRISGCEFQYASGEGGRGLRIKDLTRPVLIEGCSGNLRIVGPSGETLGHVAEGYEQNWS